MTPAPIRAVFQFFEERVNGQVFSLLDDAVARVEALDISFHAEGQDPIRNV
ncbi:hypothetical protein [Archangium sp.]|uniref:hypothetical protein n=1 Tax=Archangium sp. TaxID=1872627 RepID=UPI002D47A60B|nr:hypothetical protein [Archangium sp.]HYO56583.1 hypothetical protein [Archangium sp.]